MGEIANVPGLAPKQTKWWKSKKVWGTIIGAIVRIQGPKWGWDVDAVSAASTMIFGGVAVEGIIDAASAFATAWKRAS